MESTRNQLEKQDKILIVDDEPYNILALKIMIKAVLPPEMKGHIDEHIDEAPNGLAALRMVKESENYRLIFMDCSMPIMDGFEATKEIRNYLKAKENL
jgi:CheY-like chemotaxis protein